MTKVVYLHFGRRRESKVFGVCDSFVVPDQRCVRIETRKSPRRTERNNKLIYSCGLKTATTLKIFYAKSKETFI